MRKTRPFIFSFFAKTGSGQTYEKPKKAQETRVNLISSRNDADTEGAEEAGSKTEAEAASARDDLARNSCRQDNSCSSDGLTRCARRWCDGSSSSSSSSSSRRQYLLRPTLV
jgi:hypothetical protein